MLKKNEKKKIKKWGGIIVKPTTKNWEIFNKYKDIQKKLYVPVLNELGKHEQAKRMENCGNIIMVARCKSCGAEHFHGFEKCGLKWCPNCQHRKMLLWLKYLMPIFNDWYKQGNYLTNLNFTVRDGKELKETLERLEKAYVNVYNGRGTRAKWKDRFPGGVRSLEVKLGKNSGEWHPHYHCLVMQPSGKYEKDYEWLSNRWHEIVGNNGQNVERKDGTPDMDWNGNVWIKKVSEKKKGGIIKAVCESLKYIFKSDKSRFENENGIDINIFGEAYNTLINKKQTQTWGLLFGVKRKIDKAIADNENIRDITDFVCALCGYTEGELIKIMYDENIEIKLLDMPKKKLSGIN